MIVKNNKRGLKLKRDMTLGREWKLILLFTLPIMAGSFLQQLYNTVDGVVVGKFIGDKAFAGVGTCTPLTFLFLAFSMGLGVGGGVIVSQFFGAKRYHDLSVAIDTALFLMGGVGLVFTVLAYVLTPFLLKTVLATPDDILDYGISYFRIYSLGLFFQFIYNGVAFSLRGMGDSRATLIFLTISTVLNGILAVLFVIGLHWGVAGTATATVLAQLVCAGVSFLYLKKRFKFQSDGRHFDWKTCKMILRYGLPAAVQQTIVSFGNTAMQRLVNGFGDAAIAAYSAGSRLNMLMFVPIVGFQSGLASFTGQNIGAGRVDRVRRGYLDTQKMAIGISVLLCIIIYLFAPTVVSMFGLDGHSLALGVEQVRFFAFVFCAFTYYMIVGGVLQGSGDVMILSVATLTALAIRVAAGYLGVHLGWLGYNAAWVTNPMGWAAAIVIVTLRYLSGKWKTKAITLRPPAEGTLCGDTAD